MDLTCLLPVTRLTIDGTDFGAAAEPDGYSALDDAAPRSPHKKKQKRADYDDPIL